MYTEHVVGSEKAAVDGFLQYLAGMRKEWNRRGVSPVCSGESDALFGASLGAKFVVDLTAKGRNHVLLYRGMVLAARILDLVHAPQGTPDDHLVSVTAGAVFACWTAEVSGAFPHMVCCGSLLHAYAGCASRTSCLEYGYDTCAIKPYSVNASIALLIAVMTRSAK